jgi:hypothetical protein
MEEVGVTLSGGFWRSREVKEEDPAKAVTPTPADVASLTIHHPPSSEELPAQAAKCLRLRPELDELFGDGVELVAEEGFSGIDAVVEDVEAVPEAVDVGV